MAAVEDRSGKKEPEKEAQGETGNMEGQGPLPSEREKGPMETSKETDEK
jgi:hypothetical protein